MKAILVTEFPEKFVENVVLPELRRRVQILKVVEPRKAASVDFSVLGPDDCVLHMTEFGSHSSSEKLSKVCRLAGVTVRSLSRKKSSWGFLPPPSDEIVVDEVEELPEPEEVDPVILERRAVANNLRGAREHAGLKQVELGARVGVSQTVVSYWESGIRRVDEQLVIKVLEVCGLPRDWRGMVKEAAMNATNGHAKVNGSPDAGMKALFEEENQRLETRCRELETEVKRLESLLDGGRFALQEAQAQLNQIRQTDAVRDALKTLRAAGLLTDAELLSKLGY